MATLSQTETLPASAVALGFNTPTGTGTNSKQTSEASVGSAATMTTGAATTADSGASSTKSSTTNESASKTGSAASETKTGGAAKVAELGNVFVLVGAAIMGEYPLSYRKLVEEFASVVEDTYTLFPYSTHLPRKTSGKGLPLTRKFQGGHEVTVRHSRAP